MDKKIINKLDNLKNELAQLRKEIDIKCINKKLDNAILMIKAFNENKKHYK